MSMENIVKRSRTSNFTSDEKRVVLELAYKYKNIIDNKKTDAGSKKMKMEAWEKISREFNAISPANINRTSENLKNFFDNQKRQARKYAADEKSECRRTGGGNNETKPNPLMDLTLSIINKKTVLGLSSKYDDDAEPLEELHADDESEMHEHLVLEVADKIVPESLQKLPLYEAQEDPRNPNIEFIELTNENVISDNEVAPNKLISKSPKQNTKISRRKSWSNRRRPATSVSQKLTDSYETLADTKNHIASIQLELLQKQKAAEDQNMLRNNQQELEKFQMKQRLLKAKIDYWKVKKEQEEFLYQLQKEAHLLDIEIKRRNLQKI